MIHKVVKHKLAKWQSFKNVSVGKTTVETNQIQLIYEALIKLTLSVHYDYMQSMHAVHFSIQLNMQYCPSEGQESVHKHRQLHLLPFMKELRRRRGKNVWPVIPHCSLPCVHLFFSSSFKMESVIYFSAKRNVREECEEA